MPIYYTGRPKLDSDMADLQKEIDFLKSQYKKNEIQDQKYQKQI